jgi:hypothetical protein
VNPPYFIQSHGNLGRCKAYIGLHRARRTGGRPGNRAIGSESGIETSQPRARSPGFPQAHRQAG